MFLKILTQPHIRTTGQLARYTFKYCKFNVGTVSVRKSSWNFLTFSHPQLVKTAVRSFSSQNEQEDRLLTPNTYEQKCNETLDSLSEYFEKLIEESPHLQHADVVSDDGVLTVKFGDPHGTYVINRQTPNLQIWLSSPTSGPKRYDYKNGQWVYRHDGVSLHELLNNEISKIVKKEVDFFRCTHSGQNAES